MSVQGYKQRLHEVIEETEDEAVLRRMLDVTNPVANDQDILDDLSPEQLARIDESMAQIKQGRVVSSSQVREQAMEWLRK